MEWNNFIKTEKLKSIFIIVCMVIYPTFSVFSMGNGVSERELALLAIMSYKNDQKENTWENTDDEEFNLKWFGGYTNASELYGWKMVDYIVDNLPNSMNGFSVITYKKGNDLVIAFRGTDNGIFRENIEYLIPRREHSQVKYLSQYIDSLKYKSFINHNTKIYMTGHSLGGYLAIYALGKILKINILKNKLVKVVTFNALGLGYVVDKSIEEQLSKVSKDILVNYAIRGDIVSKIGKHYTKLIYLDRMTPKLSTVFPNNPHLTFHFLCEDVFPRVS